MPAKKLDFDAVRELAAALPGVGERPGRGGSSLTVRGKMLACRAVHRSAEPDSLVVRIGFAERAELLAAEPETYYVTEHYVPYPSVLVRLSRINRASLQSLLERACRFVSEGRSTRSAVTRKSASRPRRR